MIQNEGYVIVEFKLQKKNLSYSLQFDATQIVVFISN